MAKKRVAKQIARGESLDKRLKFKFNERQLGIISQILDDRSKVVFIDGPAGTSKTFLAVYCGLKELFQDRKSSMLYIRTAAESGRINIGARPGEISEKIHHLVGPLVDKLDELLNRDEVSKLLDEVTGKIEAMPVNDIRGSNWVDKYIIIDESQNFEFSELVTVITRLGEGSKIIFVGDYTQSDIRKSGWKQFIDLFSDVDSERNGAFRFDLTHEDIVRSQFLKFVVRKLEAAKQGDSVSFPEHHGKANKQWGFEDPHRPDWSPSARRAISGDSTPVSLADTAGGELDTDS